MQGNTTKDWYIRKWEGKPKNEWEWVLFPDIRGFFDQAHGRHVRTMMNDHPGWEGEGSTGNDYVCMERQPW